MKIQATSITCGDTLDKIDLPTIEQALEDLELPELLSKYDALYVCVIARSDEAYPEEHYRIGNDLYVNLLFDVDVIRQFTAPEIADWVKTRVVHYLSTIENVEERHMQPVDEEEANWWEDK